MTNKQICNTMFVPYIATIGAIAYFVTPWVLLIFAAGYSCKDSEDNLEPRD